MKKAPLLHQFSTDVSSIEIPKTFTFPFYYEPHELAELAAKELQHYLDHFENWFYDLKLGPENYQHPLGKMFGVLVVKDENGKLGYLCAFSGVRTGEQQDDFFVPLIYNMFEKHSWYAQKSHDLKKLNLQIEKLERGKKLKDLRKLERLINAENKSQISTEKHKQQDLKRKRKQERENSPYPESSTEFQQLLESHKNQSMASKFLIKEYTEYLSVKLAKVSKEVKFLENEIHDLKAQRKNLSNALQEWIFKQYKFSNAKGKQTDALTIFKNKSNGIPPSGTGDCAAPKLLQYAYQNNLQPIALAEFWYGESLRSQIRKHGQFYPSCRSKCEPVLNFMMQGLQVDPNPMLQNPAAGKNLSFIYQDDHFFAVDKPAEFLSVKGKVIEDSVESRVREKFPHATGPLLVHRLDMSTSGILLGTKSLKAHKALQEQFEKRTIKKRYIALLEGVVAKDEGYIDLPLRVDLDNRPFQMVDHEKGKSARTRYEVLHRYDNETRVAFYPITGRTHQLRVHASHPLGLNCPIKGDDLYGNRSDRLYLHAEKLMFNHPITVEKMILKVAAPF